MQLALYQPDIPQNVGSIVRLAACMGVVVHIVEPCGFLFDDKRMKRAAMDYGTIAEIRRHSSWEAFLAWREENSPDARLMLLTTKTERFLTEIHFEADDILLLGRESAGVPDAVHAACNVSLRIPMQDGARSLNVAQAAAIALAEGLRQTGGFPQGVAA